MSERAALAETCANRTPRTELSNEVKSRLVGRRLGGQSYAAIAAAESLSKSTVAGVLRRTAERKTVQSRPRSGKPRKCNARDERLIVRYARTHPRWRYEDLKTATGLRLEVATFRRILARHNIFNSRANKSTSRPVQRTQSK